MKISNDFFSFMLTFGIVFVLFTSIWFSTSEDIHHEKEYTKEVSDMITLIDVKNEVVSLSIGEGERNILMEEGEVYTLGEKSDYSGTIEIMEMKDDSAIIKVDLDRTIYYYIINVFLLIIISLTISVLFTLFMYNLNKQSWD